MQIFECQHQRLPAAYLEKEALQRIEAFGLDRFRVGEGRQVPGLFDAEQMKQDRAILLGVDAYRAQRGTQLLRNRLGAIGFKNAAMAAQQIEDELIRNAGAIRHAAAIDPDDIFFARAAAQFGQEPRLANAGLADDGDNASASVFNFGK